MNANHKNYSVVMGYARGILDGNIIANTERKQACERFFADIESDAWDFRVTDAEFVIQIIEELFVHIKGPLKGKPLTLEPWQKFIVYNICGFYHKGTKERRFKEAFVFVPRKNGKTTFIAALAWALSLLEYTQASTVLIVGSVLKNAMESFDIIYRNIRMMGIERDFRILNNNSEHSINRVFYNAEGREEGSIRIEALASNPDNQDGYNANIIICDEIHAYKNSNQYYVMRQSGKAYPNRLLLGITTAGQNFASFCAQRLRYCQQILSKDASDEQYFVFICKADEPDDYTNPVEHEKANPSYGVTIRREDLVSDALQAQNDPTARDQFLNKSLNIYTNAMNTYFSMSEVEDSDKKHNWSLEELAKLPVTWYGGTDLSKMHDLTAAGIYGRYKDVDIVIAHGFIPIVEAHRKAGEDNIPFIWWKEQEWLTLCNSEIVEYEDVVKWYLGLRKMGFRIKLVGFDKYNSRDYVESMTRAKFKMINQDQAYWKKSEAFREIERKIKTGCFYYVHNQAFHYCIGNVKAVEDSNEKVRYEKVGDKQRIDLFEAAVIGCKRMLEDQDKQKAMEAYLSNGKQRENH